MATGLANRPDQDSDVDPFEQLGDLERQLDAKYGGQFEHLDKGNDSGDTGTDSAASTPESIEQAEANPSMPDRGSTDEKQPTTPDGRKGTPQEESAQGGWRTNLKARSGTASSNRKFALGLGGGLAAILIAAVVALISFLMPFKLTHIVENIEQRVGEVPQYAVERRMEFYMSRYLMIRALEDTGRFDFGPDGRDRQRFTYLGSGFWDSMYTNWKGAKLEQKLANEYNVKISARNINPEYYNGNRLRANEFRIETLGAGRNSALQPGTMERAEVRQFIRDFSREETRSRQVMKRYHMRKVMKKYYGVGSWRPFERQRDNVTNKYLEKKKALKRRLVNETVGRLSERFGLYMTCLLEATDSRSCRNLLRQPDPGTADGDPDSENSGTDDTTDITDSDDGNGDSDASRRTSRQILEIVQKFGFRKIMTTLVAGIGAVEGLIHIYDALDNGIINQVIYDKNAQQYMAYGATFMSGADQIRSGENFDIEDVRASQEILNNYDKSPLYQAGTASAGTVSASGRISRDCDNDESNGKETLLDEGETICPNKKLLQDKTQFTDNAGWQALGTALTPFRALLQPALDAVDAVLGAIVSATHADDIITTVAGWLGIDGVLQKAMGLALNVIAAPVISGAEVEEDAYDALYASIAVRQSAVGGEAGASKEDTIGGGYLSDAQTAVIHDSQMSDYYASIKNKPLLARYFSPSIKESLTGQLALAMPHSLTSLGNKSIKLLGSPLKFFSLFSSPFKSNVSAQTSSYSNPFGVLNMGFADNHEVFTANGGEGMYHDAIRAKYQCDRPVGEREQNTKFGRGPNNELPFDVPLEADPCLLEEAVTDASTRYFTGTFDEGIDGPGSVANSTTNTGSSIVGDPYTDSTSVPCAPGTRELPGTHDAYADGKLFKVKLCSVSNLPSSGSSDNPGPRAIPGADGHAIVNSRVSGAWFKLVSDAAAAGVTLNASSSFRTMQHQQSLCNGNAGCKQGDSGFVARPGYSSHQAGVAIDFSGMGIKGGSTCASRATAPNSPGWVWLRDNASKYGFKQYSAEAWHWDALQAANRCG